MPDAIRLYTKLGYCQYEIVRYVDETLSPINQFLQRNVFYFQGMYFYRKSRLNKDE